MSVSVEYLVKAPKVRTVAALVLSILIHLANFIAKNFVNIKINSSIGMALGGLRIFKS